MRLDLANISYLVQRCNAVTYEMDQGDSRSRLPLRFEGWLPRPFSGCEK